MIIKAKKNIRHNNELFLPGDVIKEISDLEAKRLVEKGIVEKLDAVIEESTTSNDGLDDDQKIGIKESSHDTLDLNFNTNELKDGAKEQGLSFKANASKKQIIDLIIENNAENYFLDQLED